MKEDIVPEPAWWASKCDVGQGLIEGFPWDAWPNLKLQIVFQETQRGQELSVHFIYKPEGHDSWEQWHLLICLLVRSLPILSLWVIPVHQPRAPCIMHQTWTGDSVQIYFTCFNAILPYHPTLTLSHRVQLYCILLTLNVYVTMISHNVITHRKILVPKF